MRLLLDTNIYVEFVLHDPAVVIDYIDEHVIRSLAELEINEAQDHKDPYDHIIIAQSLSHRMTLVSSDTKFPFYCRQGLKLIQNI